MLFFQLCDVLLETKRAHICSFKEIKEKSNKNVTKSTAKKSKLNETLADKIVVIRIFRRVNVEFSKRAVTL